MSALAAIEALFAQVQQELDEALAVRQTAAQRDKVMRLSIRVGGIEEALAAAREAESVECTGACMQANPTSPCECICEGVNHGAVHRPGIEAAQAAVKARTVGGFTPGMLANQDKIDEEW